MVYTNYWSSIRTAAKYSSIAILFFLALLSPQIAQAQATTYDFTKQCFATADEQTNSGGGTQTDTFVRLDRTTGQSFVIGLTGTTGIEAMAFGPNGVLYAADTRQLGTIDIATGTFTPLAQQFGTASNGATNINLTDVDSLAYDVQQGVFFGAHRRSGPDVLFAADPATGAHIPDFFGPGIDYRLVPAIVDEANRTLDDVDDLAFDPVTNVLYASINSGGTGGVLATLDHFTGVATRIATFRYSPATPLAGQVVDDMEGLAFFNDGQLYGSTGNNGPDNNDKDKLFRIDKDTAESVLVGMFPTGQQDYEALDCLTAQAYIVLEKLTNGPGQLPDEADTPTGPEITPGSTVTWTYIITNTGIITLTDLTLTDDKIGQIGPGGLSNCPVPGTILSPGASTTCTATGIAQVGQYVNNGLVTGLTQIGVITPRQTVTSTDPSHYFGTGIALPAIVIKKATNGEDADTPTGPLVPVGGAVTWTYVVTNTGNVPLTQVVVTDDKGVVVTCPKDTLAPQESMTCTGTGVAVEGQYANIGSVVGTPPSGTPVTSSDPSHYYGYIPASVGNYVFGDINPTGSTPGEIEAGNGLQDTGEVGIDGIIVQLYSSNNVLIAETVTADGGKYLFSDLPPGDYYVVFINPFSEGVWTAPNEGTDDEIDSDPGTTVTDPRGDAQKTETFTLVSGQTDLTWDAGLVGLSSTASATVGDFVWFDLNKDGIQDPGEPGFAGVTVQLFNADTNALLRTTQTNQNGRYLFTGIDAGNYYIQFALPDGFTVSPQNAGGDDERDSDVDPITGRTAVFNLPIFTTDLRWDAGIFQVGTDLDPDEEPGQLRLFLPLITSVK